MNEYIKNIAAFNNEIDALTNQSETEAAISKCYELQAYLENLESTNTDSFDISRVLGIGYFDLGSSYRVLSIAETAETAYLASMDHLQRAIKSDEHKEFATNQLAACKNHLGLLFMDQGPVGKAIKYLDQAIWDRKYIVDQYPQNMENKVYLAGALCNRGHVERNAGRPKSASIHYKDSIALLEEVLSPYDPENQDAYASAISNAMGHPHWVITAQSFLQNASAGLEAAQS